MDLTDAPTVNVLLNLLQAGCLVALLRWVRHGCEELAQQQRERSSAPPPEPVD